MRKIPEIYEDYIDNIFIKITIKLLPLFKSLNLTPNMLTTISLLFGLLSSYYLYNHNLVYFSIFFLISYLFDTADGYYARTYNMTSKFGDYYDHFKDNFVGIIIFYILYKKYNITDHKLLLIIYILLYFIAIIHLGCQEKIYSDKSEDTLHFTRKLCYGNPYEKIKISKFCGTGTLQIITIIFIYIISFPTISP